MSSVLFSRRSIGSAALTVLCGLAVVSCAGFASAQISPIAGTGFNENIVLGVGETWPGTLTATVDNGTNFASGTPNTWFQLGAASGTPGVGVPMNTTLTMSSVDPTTGVANTYQMPNVGTNNAIFLASDGNGPTSGTYTFTTSGAYSTLSLLGADGNGAATVNVAVNYVGGAIYNTSFSGQDWFTNSTIAYYANGRVNSTGFTSITSGSNSAVPGLHYYDLTGIPTAQPIQSITFSVGSIGTTHPFIFAVSGLATSLPNYWTGNSSGIWSLASSDTNWSTPSQTYSDFSNIAFTSAGSNPAITIAQNVQPSNVLFYNGSTPYSFSGASITGTGSVTLASSSVVNSAAGSVTFNNSNTYTGGTTIASGTLTLASASALQGNVTITGGQLLLANANPAPNSIVSVGATNGLALSLGNTSVAVGGLAGGSGFALLDTGSNAVALTVGGSASSAYSGAISGGPAGGNGSLVKVGTGIQALSGASTFRGGVTFNGGVISASSLSVGGTNSSALGEGPANASGQSITFNGGILNYTGPETGASGPAYAAAAFNPNITLLTNGGTINNVGTGQICFSGTLAGAGNLTIADTAAAANAQGTQVFFDSPISNVSSGFTGNIIIAAGGAVQYRTGALNPFGTTAYVQINAGGVLQADNGATSPATLPNALIMNGGSLNVQNPSSGGVNFTGPVTINAGTSNDIGNPTGNEKGLVTLSGNLLGSGSVTTTGTNTVTLSGTNNSSFSGTWQSFGEATSITNSGAGSPNATWIANGQGYNVNVPGGGTVNFGALGGNTGTVQNGLAATSSTLAVGALGTNTTFGGTFGNGAGTLAVDKVGAGLLTLTGASPSPGPLAINGGTLQLNGSVAGPITNNAVLSFNNAGAQVFANSVSGAGPVYKAGAGALTMSYTGNQTYTGATTVTGGTLLANSVFTNSPFSVGAGATLSGSGSLSAGVTINNGGSLANLAAGSSIYTGNLTYTGTGSLVAAVSAAPFYFPITTNTVTAGAGSILFTPVPIVPATGTYQIMNYAGADPFSAFVLNVPPNRVMSLADSSSANTIALVVNTTTTPYPIWSGLNNGSWDYTTTGNWNLSTDGSPTTFMYGDHPLFDDTAGTAGGTTSVAINNGNVLPSIVTFNNNNYAYAISGSNGITGPGSVVLSGTGTVTISTSNNYSGGTTISAGQLNINNASAIGSGPLTIAGAGVVLGNTSSAAIALSTNNSQFWNGDFSFAGSNNLNLGSGPVTLGSSRVVTVQSGNLTVGGPIGGAGASLTLAGTGQLTLTGASTFNGGVAINGGVISTNTLSVGGTSSSGIGEGPADASGQSIAFSGGMLTYTGGGVGTAGAAANSLMFNPNITVNASGGTINNAGSGSIGFAGSLTGPGNLTFVDTAVANSSVLGNQVFFQSDSASSTIFANFTGNIIIGAGGNIQIRNSTVTNFGPTATVFINTGGIISSDKGNAYSTGISNAISLSGGSLATQGASMNYSGPVTVNPGFTSYIGDYSGSTGSLTIGGSLLGSGTVNASIAGTTVVTLSGNTSGFAGTWLATGAPTAFTGNATGSTAAVFNVNGSGYNINNSGVVNFGALGGNTGTIQNGVASTSSTLSVGALGTNMTYGGTIANGAGNLTLALVGSGSLTIPGPGLAVNVVDNSTLVFASSASQFYAGSISGTGAVGKIGTGALILNSPQTYSGATTISSGTVQLAPNALAGFGALGTGWNVNNNSISSNPFPSANVLELTDATVGQARSAWYTTKVHPNSGFTATFTYTDANGGGADGVTFCLQNASAGTGALGGTGGALGYAGAVVTPSVAIALNLYSGVNQTGYNTDGSQNYPTTVGSVNLHSEDPINVTVNYNAATQVLAWSLFDPVANTSFSTSQTGVNLSTILGSSNDYIGFTGGEGGVTSLQTISNFSYTPAVETGNNILPTGTSVALNGVLDLDGVSQTVGSLYGSGTLTNSQAAQVAFAAGGDNSSGVFSGLLLNGAGTMAVTKAGTGSWTLTGNNVWSGGTTISGGTLQIGNGGATGTMGSGPISMSNNSVLAYNRSDSITVNAPINGSGSLAQLGGGTLTLAQNNGYSSGTVINNGTVQVGNGGNTGTLGPGPIANNGAVVFNRTDSPVFANTLSGSGAIYQVGGGSLALSGPAASFNGPMTVSFGNLYVNGSNAAGSIAVGPGPNGPGSFILGGSGSANSATATVAGGGGVEGGYNGHGTLTLGGLNFQGAATVFVNNISQYSSAAAIDVTGSNALTTTGNDSISISLAGAAPTNTVPQIAHLLQYSGAAQGSGTAAFNPSLSVNITGLSSRAILVPLFNDPGPNGTNYIDLQYSIDYPYWTGGGDGTWITSNPGDPWTQNWRLQSTGGTTNFLTNDAPVFDDRAGGNSTVNISAGNVSPASVTFANTASSYLVTGSYGITSQNPIAVNFNGLGAVTIATSNNYFGTSTLNSGLLNLANPSALGSAALGAALTINGGSLDNVTVGPMTTEDYPINWNGPFTFVGSNPLTFGDGSQLSVVTLGGSASVNVAGSTLTITDPIQDNGLGLGFTKSGGGVLQLLGSNTYTGPTIVSGGTLQVGNGGSGASINTSGMISLAANTALNFNDSDTVAMSSPITGQGAVLVSAGFVNLTGTNSYTGGTTVGSSAALELSVGGPTGALAPNSTLTVGAGGTLFLNASGALGSSGSSTNLVVNDGVVIANSGFRIPLWNTVNLTGGILASGAGNGDGNGNYSLSGQINATSDAIGAGNPSEIVATQVSLLNNTVLNVTRGPNAPVSDLVVTSVISSFPAGNSLTIQGNGATQLLGANTYNGGTMILGGTAQAANSSAFGTGALTIGPSGTVDLFGTATVAVDGLNGSGVVDDSVPGGPFTLMVGTYGGNGTFSGTIQNSSGAVALTKAGSGTQILSGTNSSYSGGTNINAGVLNFANGALGAGTVVISGGTLQFATGNTQDISANGITLANSASVIDTNGNNVNFMAGSIGGAGGLTKIGAGTLTLANANTFTGVTNISAGTINVAHPLALQGSTVNLTSSTNLVLSGAATSAATFGGLSGSASFNLGPTALTVGANNANTQYTGVLSNGSGFTKTGSGALTLNAPQNYAGATNISGGVLKVIGVPVAITTLQPIAGLEYQLDASNSASVTGPAVNTWNDLSGNGNNFTVGAGATAPTLVANALNGLPMVQFNYSASTALTLSNSAPAGTVFLVNIPSTTQQRTLTGIWGNYNNAGSDGGIRTGDVNGTWRGLPTYAGDNTDGNDFTNNATLPGTTYISTSSSFDANTTNFGSLGTPQILVATGSANYAVTGIGSYFNGITGGRIWSGDIGEVLVYNSQLSNVQRQEVEAYLDYKWFGVTTLVTTGGGVGLLPANTPMTISNGGTFDMTNGTQTIASLSSTDGNGSQVLLGSGGQLTITGPTITTFDGAISGAGGAVTLQSGALTLTGTNSYTGPTTVSSGTLQLGDGVSKAGALTSNITNNSTVVFASPLGQTQLYSNAISGSGSVVVAGPGLTQLTATHSYAGSTLVSAGTLQLGIPTTTLVVTASHTGTLAGFGADTTGSTGQNSTWTFNGTTVPTTSVTGGSLTLTDGANGETRTAYLDARVAVNSPFTVSFVYNASGAANNMADGMTFILQNSGTGAIGGGGGSLAYSGITPSAAVALVLYPANGSGRGTDFYTGGVTNSLTISTSSAPYITGGGVALGGESGDPIQVVLSYDGSSTLTESMTDTTTLGTFSYSITGENLASIIGGSSAYAGFTGATGGLNSTQVIGDLTSNLIYTATDSTALRTFGPINILPVTTNLSVVGGATLDLASGSQTVASLSGSGVVTNSFSGGLGLLTVGGPGNTTFAGTIQDGAGQVGLAVAGNGMLTLSGTNTYTGGTFVEGSGTLMTALGDNEAIADGSNLYIGSAAGLAEFGGVIPAATAAPASSPATAAVPEPGTLALVAALAGGGLAFRRIRRRRRGRAEA